LSGTTSQYEKIRTRLYAVSLLRFAKRRLKYRELAEILGVDMSLLARYVSGLVVPSYEQSLSLINALRNVVSLEDIVREEISRHKGYVDLSGLLSDTVFLELVGYELSSKFNSPPPDAVIVPETSGISLATEIARQLQSRLVVARKRKDNPMEEYYEEHLIIPPNVRRSFYVRKSLVRPGDSILIVDDIVHSGLTLSALERLIRRINGRLLGVASIVVVGGAWRDKVNPEIRIESILEIF